MHIGPFQLEELLGKGGMGEVWSGFHIEQQQPVAVKVILREGATQRAYIEAFRNEVQAMATLDHPGVIAVLDYGLIDSRAAKASSDWLVQGTPYLVMELAERGSLEKWIYRLQWADVQSTLLIVLDALAHAHAHGVIHRDLKPQNLLLGFGETSAIKLTDFGLAHALDDDERDGRFESVWGTPAYMAPEQIKGLWREYGPWTDLYALGCMAYELVTGKPPFWGENPSACWKGHLHQDVPRWKPRMPVPPRLESWVLKLLQKDPQARFQHAADAAFALTLICEESPTQDFAGPHNQLQLHFLSTSSQQTLPEQVLRHTAVDPDVTTHNPQHSTKLTTLDWDSFAESMAELSEISESIDAQAEELTPFPDIKPPFPSTWEKQHGALPRYRLHGTGLHLHKLKTLRMVDRQEERNHLWETFKAAYVMNEPQVALIAGPPGVGKSRLAQWLSTRAHEQGAANTMNGTFSQTESVYDGLLPMFARYLQCMGLDYKSTQLRIAKFLKRYGAYEPTHFLALAHILLEHDADYLASAAAEHNNIYTKQQRYHVLMENLSFISNDRATIIVLDDIQWGAEALLFVNYVLRHASEMRLPVLFVLTYRPGDLDNNGLEKELIERLQQHQFTQHINLPPLETKDFSELVQHMIPLTPKLTRQVELRAHGIPQFAIQLISNWIDQARLEPHPEGFSLKQGQNDLPDDIHDLMQRHLEKLPDEHLMPLYIAAALGLNIREREWEHTAKLMGLYDVTLLIDYLQDADVIHSADDDTWRFTHNMLRESLTRDAKELNKWQEINASCAQTLVELYPKLGPHQERRAFHLLEAKLLEQALEAIRLAAMRRRRRSELLRTHRLLDRHDAIAAKLQLPQHDSERLQAALLRAGTFDMQGRYREAERWARQAHELALIHGPTALMLSGALHRAWATLHVGLTQQAQTWFDQALTLTDDPMTQRACYIGLARIYQRRGQLRRAHETFHDALRQAQKDQHREHIATCLNGLGDIARQRNALEEARDYSEQSLELSQRMSHRFLLGDCYTDLAELHRYQHNHSRATLMASKALSIFSSIESNMTYRVRIQLALIALEQGALKGAFLSLKEVVLTLESLGDKGQLPLALLAQCPWLASQAEWDTMRPLLEHVSELIDISQRRHRDLVHLAQLTIESTANGMPEDIHFALHQILSERQPSLDD